MADQDEALLQVGGELLKKNAKLRQELGSLKDAIYKLQLEVGLSY